MIGPLLAAGLLLPAAAALPVGTAPILPPGPYALVIHVATVADSPWFFNLRGGSTSRVLVNLLETPGGMRQTGSVCGVKIDGGGIARIDVPPAFVAALGERSVDVTLRGGNYEANLGLDVVGFAGSGPLPTDIADTVDWDGDGRPAATVQLKVPAFGAAELYVVQAAELVLSGPVRAGGVDGKIGVVRFEQATLDARPTWLAMKTRVRVDLERSGFTLRPLPPGSGCSAVSVL